MKKILLICFLSVSDVYAGLNGLTHHSRANCLNNESISWDATEKWNLKVVSTHNHYTVNEYSHEISDGWSYTNRAAAVHWGEGDDDNGYWTVWGYHYMIDDKGKEYLAWQEVVCDCNLYNGWWDWGN